MRGGPLLVLAMSMWMGAAAAAQQPPGTEQGRIRLNVVVTDKSGKPVSGLQQSDFTLLDNNQPRKIAGFHAYGGETRSTDSQTQIVIAIDEANIDFMNVSSSRYEIGRFLRANGGKLAHPVSLVWVTDQGLKLIAASSLDGNALATQLDASEYQMRTLRRSAGVWGAIERLQISIRLLEQMVDALDKQPGRKELIWIGPGWPMFANPSLQLSRKEQESIFRNVVDLNTRLREGQIALYSVTMGISGVYTFLYESYLKGVKKADQAYPPALDLKVLAIQSGGNALPPDNDLSRALQRCVEDADAYYGILFLAPPADGPDEYHELKLKVAKPGLTARTSVGYYNQPR